MNKDSVLYYAAAGIPAAVYIARRTALEPRGQELQITWLTAITCLALVHHRSKLHKLTQSFFSRGQNIQDEENDSDDDIPDLKPLVHSSESKTTSPILLNNMNMIYDDDKTEWEEDCPPRFARNRIQHAAFIWCRHDLDVCTRAHPGSNRTWDNALGAVPIESATRWKQCEQQREKQMKREDRGDYNVPPPRTPQKATVCYSA